MSMHHPLASFVRTTTRRSAIWKRRSPTESRAGTLSRPARATYGNMDERLGTAQKSSYGKYTGARKCGKRAVPGVTRRGET